MGAIAKRVGKASLISTAATLLWLQLWLASGCGGDDPPSEGEKACQELEAKLDECMLTPQGTQVVCNEDAPCAVHCAVMAECSQLAAGAPSGTYGSCVAACSGAAPDDFICANGRQFVKKQGVCDGQFQCLDGSDEANCPGAAGAGG